MLDRISSPLRDLEWVVNSPSLIDPPCHQPRPLDNMAEVEIETLVREIQNLRLRRVGLYFETLVKFWLTSILKLEIVEYQRQIFHEGRTVGEIDFVYRRADGGLTHLETSVKFYLYAPVEEVNGIHFIGPNSADTFERKLNRLFEHQLLIGERNFPDIDRKEAFVKGRLFYRPDSNPPEILPERLSSDHCRGKWIYARELDWLSQYDSSTRFLVLKKPCWLSTVALQHPVPEMMTHAEFNSFASNHFQKSIRPLLASVLVQDGSAICEIERFFIVADEWPNRVK